MNNYYKSGSWNIICQVCGKKFKSDEIRKRWDGLLVCHSDYETRHILDFIKVRDDDPSVPYVAPEPADQFIPLCQYPNTGGMAGLGVAGCAVAGFAITHAPIPTRHVPIAGLAVVGCTYPAKDNIYD